MTDREEYIKIKEKFDQKKEGLSKKINEQKNIILKAKEEKSELEENLKKARPILEDCDSFMICKNCDIYSMKHEYTLPGQGERTFFYECVICKYRDSHT
jgi:hypothetical protein